MFHMFLLFADSNRFACTKKMEAIDGILIYDRPEIVVDFFNIVDILLIYNMLIS